MNHGTIIWERMSIIGVAIIFFELRVVKVFMQKFLTQETSRLILCVKIVLDYNSFIYIDNCLKELWNCILSILFAWSLFCHYHCGFI